MIDPAEWIASALNREATGDYSDTKLAPLAAVLAHLPTIPAPVTVAGTKGKGSTVRLLESIVLALTINQQSLLPLRM